MPLTMALAGVQVSRQGSVTRAVVGPRPNLFHPSNPSFLSATVPAEGRWSNIGIRRPASSDASTLLANQQGNSRRRENSSQSYPSFVRARTTVQILRQISTLCARIATRFDAITRGAIVWIDAATIFTFVRFFKINIRFDS